MEKERKRKLIEVSKSKRISRRRDRYQKCQQECVEDQQLDGYLNMIIIQTGFKSQKYVSQRSIQQDME